MHWALEFSALHTLTHQSSLCDPCGPHFTSEDSNAQRTFPRSFSVTRLREAAEGMLLPLYKPILTNRGKNSQ